MSGARQLRRLWRRGQRGWPERFPLAQLPNPPLLLAMSAGLVAKQTNGPVQTGARATSQAAFAFWAWGEATGGVNFVRRAVGAAALAYTVGDIPQRGANARACERLNRETAEKDEQRAPTPLRAPQRQIALTPRGRGS